MCSLINVARAGCYGVDRVLGELHPILLEVLKRAND